MIILKRLFSYGVMFLFGLINFVIPIVFIDLDYAKINCPVIVALSTILIVWTCLFGTAFCFCIGGFDEY